MGVKSHPKKKKINCMIKAIAQSNDKMYFMILPYFPSSTLFADDITEYSCGGTVSVFKNKFLKKLTQNERVFLDTNGCSAFLVACSQN
jgi:hypothetical protein